MLKENGIFTNFVILSKKFYLCMLNYRIYYVVKLVSIIYQKKYKNSTHFYCLRAWLTFLKLVLKKVTINNLFRVDKKQIPNLYSWTGK